ncbi:MAG: hypothetical protein A2W71_03055 [Candidatus Nealsonbacteria bacterium RIFCSPLOWO2_02_39_8]|uniref:Glycosyltransferase 2-like domain-containing protein n=4 Tax=Parcubacteria group TaxID=1794811 RepID=A0A1G2EGY8_9BACT|nr:MAG: UDP-glucose-undecaprenyl-phosphate glucosyltransferase [Candidatus Jorgensenbacteria bacterium GW2011_GWF2_41_8]KKS96847.1 MAG: UDP-glucose-undecaprenyl-phosphate glucosyltransferase [Candidatus Giovannonibacteria bacterium GW2011_GWB1_43_13]KKS99651.1 MAG: UDP-glucose-undecaprenyl-phosphate glucosyltransferase [Candidatus Giovannonibacteria bacterium GW2011_GWA1_43_15]KKT21493.1 MAG: UDP-glucose-undecaprenyl-phosphate glucosyltransferase [Candidatus Giovannonibacteria bacterium GW2011_G
MADIELSIVLPVFNGADILEWSLKWLQSWIIEKPYKVELIVVNDGSTDATKNISENFLGTLDYYQFINFPENRGKGFATKAGMRAASGKFVVFTDADLSYGVDIFDAMHQCMRTDKNIQLLYGSRRHPQSKGYAGYTKLRRFSSLLFSNLVCFIVLPGVKDTQCGVKMFRKEFAALAAQKLTINHFAFDIELFVIAKAHNLMFQDFPVALSHREESSVRLITDALFMIKDICLMKINIWLGRYK